MSVFRPLPARPSLEFERKESKALLRRLRAGDTDALARARARHPAIDASAPDRIRLADAQLVIAREYGFTSWPRLVRYFGDVDRQRHSYPSIQSSKRDFYDGFVRSLLVEHRDKRMWTARSLAARVPRFYGMSVEDVFAATVTEDDARLAVARQHGFPSWEVLLDGITLEQRERAGDWEVEPGQLAWKAIEAADLEELKRVVAAHPRLLHPSDYLVSKGGSLMRSALSHERRKGAEIIRPIIEWLVSQGLDVQFELNRQLCGHMRMKPEKVRWLLERGADPNWVAPNGIPVLEHALVRYWNGEAVDVVAARAVPRKALWIAAGLGDVNGVRRFLDTDGKPIAAARKLRPDFDAVGPMSAASHPEPTDEEILVEAFFIAMLNGRTTVIEYMVSRGFPLDSLVWGSPLVHFPIGNAMPRLVEILVRAGADLDLRGWRPQSSGREMAREMVEMDQRNPDRRRIAELCGLDPEAIIAERDARPVPPPNVAPALQQALELAGDDAFRLGQPEICPEHLLYGLLRVGGLPVLYFAKASGADLDRLRADTGGRVLPAEDRVERPKLPFDAAARATIEATIAIATERRRQTVHGLHLLHALTRTDDGPAGELLARYGSSTAKVRELLERAI